MHCCVHHQAQESEDAVAIDTDGSDSDEDEVDAVAIDTDGVVVEIDRMSMKAVLGACSDFVNVKQ